MDATVTRADLLRALTMCATVVDKKSSKPILQGVLVVADAATLRIAGTDLDITLQAFCPVRVRDGGSFVIDLETLTKFTQNAPDDSVTLTTNDANRTLRIVSGTAKFAIPTLDAADFPVLPEPDDSPAAIADSMALFASGCAAVAYASGDGADTRSYENAPNGIPKGVLLRAKNGTLEFCATDGRRIAHASVAVDEGWLFENTVPLRAARALAKLATEDGVTVRETTNHVFFESEQFVFSYRRQDVGFPNITPYTTLRPDGIVVERKRLTEAIRRVLLLTPNHQGVDVAAKDGRLTILPMRNERGDGSDYMSCEGGELAVTLSGRYLTQALDVMGADKVSIGTAPNGMVIVRSVADDLDGVLQGLHCLAPMSETEGR